MVSAKKKQAQELRDMQRKAKAAQVDAKKKESAGKKKSAKPKTEAVSRPKSVLITADDIAASEAASAAVVKGLPEPPHRHEVHLKKGEITFHVTLHGIPPKHIDVSGTTNSRFVVDTSKHTKKLRLDMPFPASMVVDSEKGDYTLTNGVLVAVFPVAKMPKAVETKWNARLASVRASQRARFDVAMDGELKVRHRKATLNAKKQAEEAAAEDEDEADVAGLEDAAARASQSKAPKEKKSLEKKSATKAEEAPVKAGKKEATKPAAPQKEKKEKKGGLNKQLDEEKRHMLKAVKTTTTEAISTLKSKLNKAREVQARRVERKAAAGENRAHKAAAMAAAFQRVLDTKKEKLNAAMEAAKPKKVDPSKPRKGVKFAP